MNEMSKPITAVSPQTLQRLIAVVGEKNAITDKDKQVPYLVEFRALWTGHSPVILRPGSTQEVSEILKIAAEIRALSASGRKICNLTVGDFAPAGPNSALMIWISFCVFVPVGAQMWAPPGAEFVQARPNGDWPLTQSEPHCSLSWKVRIPEYGL